MGAHTGRAASAPSLYFNTACHLFYPYECIHVMQTIVTVPQLSFEETLTLSRFERDQLVIFDPRCAPFIRPLLRTADLQPWYTPTGAHWMIVAPETGLPPRLAQHLAAVAPPDAPKHWWTPAPPPHPRPRIVIRPGPAPAVSWDQSDAVLGAPALVIAPAEPFTLALLASSGGLAALHDPEPAALAERIAAVTAPAPAREHLGALALQRVEWARAQHQADADYARRLLADFGPPGVRLSPRLEHWWALSVEELFAALEADLRNGVPTEFQPFYAQRHNEALDARRRLNAQIAEVEAMLEAQATTCWSTSGA